MDTAQLLGNFGEFFGAIAVVATLTYLAVQVRHGAEASRLDGQARVLEMANQALILRTTPAASRIWLTGLATPGELTLEEKNSFYNMLLIQANALQITQLNKESSPFLQDLEVRGFSGLAKYPGFRRWYESNRDYLGPVVTREIDEALREVARD
jgi:hypothetical protein